MSREDDLVFWSSVLDNKYTVQVTRTVPYRGELKIADGENVRHREDVALSYDALFGPDVSDVDAWQEVAIRFVDKVQRS